jgi:hypothetical protein
VSYANVIRFPDVADSRIRSVNHSPLGAASQTKLSQTRYRSFTSVRAGSQEEILELQNEKVMQYKKYFVD